MLKMNLSLFAHKKGGGSTSNGRDSQSENVGRGGDDTLFAKIEGVVKFERFGRDKKKVSVYPVAKKA